MGGGGPGVVAPVAVRDPHSVWPVEPVATILYVVVTVGKTVREPLSATGAPFNVALTALRVVHVITEDCPRVIEVALALAPAATAPPLGGPGGGGGGTVVVPPYRYAPRSVAPVCGRGVPPKSVATPASATPAPRAREMACSWYLLVAV